jgi:hypothetical protein
MDFKSATSGSVHGHEIARAFSTENVQNYGCWCPAIPALREVCPCQHLQASAKYGFTDKTALNGFWAASRAVRACSTESTVLCTVQRVYDG